MNRTHLKVLCILVGALVLITACGGNAATPTSTAKDVVNYQMGWVHEYSSTPFYMAIANGHYAEANLDVKLSLGGFGEDGYVDPIEQVVSGAADFSQASLFSLLEARAAGKPVVAIATVNQRSPFAILSLKEKGIINPGHLADNTVAVATGGAQLNYDALLRSLNIDPATMNTVERTAFGIEPLVDGEVDAFGGWIINEGVALQEAGHEINSLLLSDYGIDTYDLLIFTTEDTIANRPDVVERFLKASLAGLKDVIDDPEKAIDVALTYDSTLAKDAQLRRLRAFIPLIQPAGTQLGMMQPEIWEFGYQLLTDAGLLTTSQDLSKAYTLDFLNKIYANQANA
jgi:NitT/TauT family transport system substrate-binding protein